MRDDSDEAREERRQEALRISREVAAEQEQDTDAAWPDMCKACAVGVQHDICMQPRRRR